MNAATNSASTQQAATDVERASDPRKPPPQEEQGDYHDPDREFARNGGHMGSPPPIQQQNYSHEQTDYRDTRPNPNKHEDG